MLYFYFFLFIMQNIKKTTTLEVFFMRHEVLQKEKPAENYQFEEKIT
jgi:hypothetical protein